MKNFIIKTFPYLRITLYIALITTFYVIPLEVIEKESLCTTYNKTGILCFSCGITRAFSNFLHVNLIKSFSYNPIFTCAICPIFLFIFFEDTYKIVKRTFTLKKEKSLLEKILFGDLL